MTLCNFLWIKMELWLERKPDKKVLSNPRKKISNVSLILYKATYYRKMCLAFGKWKFHSLSVLVFGICIIALVACLYISFLLTEISDGDQNLFRSWRKIEPDFRWNLVSCSILIKIQTEFSLSTNDDESPMYGNN